MHLVARRARTTAAAVVVSSTIAISCGTGAVVAGVPPDTGADTSTSAVANGDLLGRRFFPADNPWNASVWTAPVDPNSAALIASCGLRNLHPDFGTTYNGAPNGIPYVLVRGSQRRVPVSFDYADESDAGPYPIPANAPIEGGANSSGDRHILIVDTDGWKLYELFDAHPVNGGTAWHAGSGAIFDLGSNAVRPAGWTSADAAGLPILPGLVRYDEAVTHGTIAHALRVTCPRTRRAYVLPARHYASNDTSSALPPMGMRVRLKSTFDTTGYPPEVRTILRAMMRYGMFVADNGTGWYVSGAPDARWSDDNLGSLKRVPSSAFEVVQMGVVVR